MAQPLLEPVAVGQTRFRMQGLVSDARGVAVGRELLVVFPSIDRLIAFLGAYSEDASLDDLVPTLTLERTRRDGGGHAFLLRCAAGDGYAVDRIARISAATRGRVHTGMGSIFVAWRDRDAPFGYDLVQPVVPGADATVVIEREHAERYLTVQRIDPLDLVQRLELRPVPLPLRGPSADPDLFGLKDMALVLVAPGLAQRVLQYLWRLEVPMAGYYCQLHGDSRPSLLLRLRHPPVRTIDVLHGTPGVELLVPVSSRAAIEVGWRHPIHLASASTCFPGDEMFLFRGTVGRVERLEGPPRFIEGRHLVEGSRDVVLRDLANVRDVELDPLRVSLQLRPTSAPREPRAVLIDWEHADLLRRLVYLIPPTALAASRVVLLERGLVVLTGSSLGLRTAASTGLGAGALVPLGSRLTEMAPGVLVPDGWELWPRVRPQLLRQLLGLDPEDYAVFAAPDAAPLRVRASDLLALDAALIGRLQLADATSVEPELPALAPARVDNRRVARFALWGFAGVREEATGDGGTESRG